MKRCIELAQLGQQYAAPNPMVGSVIVHNNKIIGEGFHRKCGEAHAEVNAVNSVKDKSLLSESTIYVSLEPCAHFGKTPPCADLIVSSGIPHVVIATVDPFAKVKGKGIEKLKNAGCIVETGILEKEARELNKRFFTFHQQKRPYVVLKWAQTFDGFIDKQRNSSDEKPMAISGKESKTYVHQIRTNEAAILVGKRTALLDDPQLNSRLVEGPSPVRITIDKNLSLPTQLNLFDQSIPTLVFNEQKQEEQHNLSYIAIDFSKNVEQQILDHLYQLNLNSIIIEGGTATLNGFIDKGLWDEAHLLTAPKRLNNGVKAPVIFGKEIESFTLGNDNIKIIKNEI